VPDVTEVKIDPVHKTLIRSGVDSIINPFDLNGLELAVQIKEKTGSEIIALSMGPVQTENALRECIAFGADKAYLVSGRDFSGSDTLATSFTLSSAVKHLGIPDLIICGKQAIDGDTAQVGPELAGFLKIPHVTFVGNIKKINKKYIVSESYTDNYILKIKTRLPALITVIETINNPRKINLAQWAKARKYKIPVLDKSILKIEPFRTGLKGSPTKVIKINTAEHNRDCEIINGSISQIADKTVKIINSSGT
jgi:electron transfer flavoprotein alpha/beta subunit